MVKLMQKIYTEKEKEALLIENNRLIKFLANKYMDLDWGFEDTYQELCMLFVKMLDKYDPEKGKITTLFYRYVTSWFTGQLMDYKYAQKRMPYGLVTSIDALSLSSSIRNRSVDKIDFFDFLESPYEIPDRADVNNDIVSFIISEIKKLPKPGILLGILFHGKTVKDLVPVYGISSFAIRGQFERNLRKVRMELNNYLKETQQSSFTQTEQNYSIEFPVE